MLRHFATAPYKNQLYFYDALNRGDTSYVAFPTGVLLHAHSATPAPTDILPPF
ncbi:hypothetical protein ACFQBQ_17115 [Granulicella cerasi]|uniref:Uncharacterized protein n=1 Tax=Granulicella cerasi TaxID=741063 RepID=A0ABW1ZDX9_9BACT|nr:hypothetical protein [Granulicella cerasi]